MKRMFMELSLKLKMFLKSEMKKQKLILKIDFKMKQNLKFSFDFKVNVKMKFTLEIRTFCKKSLALMDHHIPAYIYDFIPTVRQSQRHPNTFNSFSCKLSILKKLFFLCFIGEWNKLNSEIRSSGTVVAIYLRIRIYLSLFSALPILRFFARCTFKQFKEY